MYKFAFIHDIQEWSNNYPWLEMLSSLGILLLFVILANFIAKKFVVEGIRKLLSKLKFVNQEIFAQHSVIRRISNIVPAIIILHGIATVPHLSVKIIVLVQMLAQAFIVLTFVFFR